MAAAVGRICGARLLKNYGAITPQVQDIALNKERDPTLRYYLPFVHPTCYEYGRTAV